MREHGQELVLAPGLVDEPPVGLGDRLLGLFALGHVVHHADRAHDAGRLVANVPALLVDGADLARRAPDHPMLDLVAVPPLLERARVGVVPGGAIVILEEGGHYGAVDFQAPFSALVPKLYRDSLFIPILSRPVIPLIRVNLQLSIMAFATRTARRIHDNGAS